MAQPKFWDYRGAGGGPKMTCICGRSRGTLTKPHIFPGPIAYYLIVTDNISPSDRTRVVGVTHTKEIPPGSR